MTRRTFTLTAAAATSAAQPRIRIAFLGVTHPHGPEKLRQMQESSEFELVGLAEKNSEAASAAEKRGVRLLSREQILGDASIAVIAVEGDVGDHAPDALAALTAGKHVHVDKAPAADLASFRKMVDLAAARKRILQVGYMWRYHPGIRAALDAARSGELGDIYLVRATINTLLNEASRKPVAAFRGGQMFELAGHLIDPMVRMMGKPARVTPYLAHFGEGGDGMMDNTAAVMEWSRGAMGVVSSAAMQVGASAHRAFEILGTKGTAIVRPIEPPALLIETAAGKRNPPMPPYKRYVDDFRDLAAAIREGRTSVGVTGAEELAVQETLLRASGMLS